MREISVTYRETVFFVVEGEAEQSEGSRGGEAVPGLCRADATQKRGAYEDAASRGRGNGDLDRERVLCGVDDRALVPEHAVGFERDEQQARKGHASL
ncbi:MAG: hypothetical protein ACYS22_07195 [Planctomycetota bacterium]